jgi:RNA polymerase sigma-70 factor (ECF subfamily)
VRGCDNVLFAGGDEFGFTDACDFGSPRASEKIAAPCIQPAMDVEEEDRGQEGKAVWMIESRGLTGAPRLKAEPGSTRMSSTAPRSLPPLLPRVAAGERAAIGLCLERYGSLVWSLARRLSPTSADAEDAVQEIFLDLWKSAERFDERTAAEPVFVAMIARRRLIDRRRALGRRPATESMPEHEEPSEDALGDPHAEVCAEVALAARAVDALRPDQRRVLVLSACEGMSHGEIAESLGMPLGTVKAHARRGLLAVREALFGREADRKDVS